MPELLTGKTDSDSGTQRASSSPPSPSRSDATRDSQASVDAPATGKRWQARRGSTTKAHRLAVASVMPATPIGAGKHLTPYSTRRRYSSRIIRTSVASVSQQVDTACSALGLAKSKQVATGGASSSSSSRSSQDRGSPPPPLTNRRPGAALTSGMQLDPLRRLSVQRMSLESSSQMGAWYKEDDVRTQPTPWYILHPISAGRVLWDYALRFLVLGTLLVVPLRLAFVYSESGSGSAGRQTTQTLLPLIVADVCLDALCVADVLSNFLFGFITVNAASAKREVVTDWRRIALRYLRHSCALEVLSIGIPFQLSPGRTELQACSMLKLLRVQRLIRVRARERHRAHEAGTSAPAGGAHARPRG